MAIDMQTFIDALAARGVSDECPRCNLTSWAVVEQGYLTVEVSDDLSTAMTGGGKGIATFAAICNNCGFVSMHAKESLGL